jgi:hypothetical protein
MQVIFLVRKTKILLIRFGFLGRLIMWFAKWFGGGNEVEVVEEDEPARFAPNVSTSVQQVARPLARGVNAAKPSRSPPKGFDPYNSGSFERRNAWERIKRR